MMRPPRHYGWLEGKEGHEAILIPSFLGGRTISVTVAKTGAHYHRRQNVSDLKGHRQWRLGSGESKEGEVRR